MLRKYFFFSETTAYIHEIFATSPWFWFQGQRRSGSNAAIKWTFVSHFESSTVPCCCCTCWQRFFKGRFVFICLFRLRRVTDRLERLSFTSAIHWLLPSLDYFAINRRKTFKSVIIIIFTFVDFEFTFLQFNCDNGHDERTRRCSFVGSY